MRPTVRRATVAAAVTTTLAGLTVAAAVPAAAGPGVAPAGPQPAAEHELRSEDERIVEVKDVEPLEPREAGDQRRVADREQRCDPVNDHRAGVRRLSVGGRGEHLDVVTAIRLAARELEARVAGAARVGREGRGEVCDPKRRWKP